MRPGSDYKLREDFEGMVQFCVRIKRSVDVEIAKAMVKADVNRTDWIRKAIMEKLERDLKQ